jgi:Spy/CpxP family protein refolding chaperone
MRRAAERALAIAAVAILAFGGVASAQSSETTTVRPARGARGLGRGGRVLPRAGAGPKQQALAKQVRQAFAGVVRTRLNLTEAQSVQLQGVDQRFQKQRNQLGREERQSRQALAAALADSAGTPDQAKISQYMDQLVQAQHKRADLLESEQKELGSFLTPVQRARFLALREQLQRRVQQLRQEGGRKAAVPEP